MALAQNVAPKKLDKLVEAERLATKPDRLIELEKEFGGDDAVRRIPSPELEKLREAYRISACEASKIYRTLCRGEFDPTIKIGVVISFLRMLPEDGREEIARFRDSLRFRKGPSFAAQLKLLVAIAKSSEIEPHERSITAIFLYNSSHLDVCFGCFESIAVDSTVPITYRVEACKYLFATEDESIKSLAQECLTEIIEDQNIPSDKRYRSIAGFIAKSGMASYLNTSKIRVMYDEGFVFGLQSTFFYNELNGIRERILSAQHMLTMECVAEQEKRKIGETLLAIASNQTIEENIRADAADVVMRVGLVDQSKTARDAIVDMGYAAASRATTVAGRAKTVYNNTQNIHDQGFEKTIYEFIEKMVRDPKLRPMDYESVYTAVAELIAKRDLDPEKRHTALKALNRVEVDTATFTAVKVTIAEVLMYVYTKIVSHPAETRRLLEQRLVDELVDMGDTCSSGHAGRFVNVLAGIDLDLRISYEAQIIANCAGRINAKIRDIPDADLLASVSMGLLPDANPDDRAAFIKFATKAFEELHTQLYQEFVGGGYITAQLFETYFAKAKTEWGC